MRLVVEEVSLTGDHRVVRIEDGRDLTGLRVRVSDSLMFAGYRPGEELVIEPEIPREDGTSNLLVSIRRTPSR